MARVLAILLLLTLGAGCREAEVDPYLQAPDYLTAVVLDGLEPARLQVAADTLFVSYNGLPRIDAYDFALQRRRTIELKAPVTIRPTAFAVDDSFIVVADHGLGIVAVFDRAGEFLTSFDRLPDGETRIQPIALTVFRKVAYVADMKSRRVLAISLITHKDITEIGELILTIPNEDVDPLGFPSTVQITPDGRLLIGDAERGEVGVFTCEGSRVYTFDPVAGVERLAPQGFAYDTIADASLADESSFDPSGIRAQGRLHLVDGYNGKVHMFNPLGRYLSSYPLEARLRGPAGIAAAEDGSRLFIADPPSGRLLVYGPKGE